MRRALMVSACCVGLIALAFAQARPPDALIASIEAPQAGRDGELPALTLVAAMKQVGVPGLSVAVIKDFDIHWTRAYGVADVVTSAPVNADTLFQAASISKPVTAMAVLKAAPRTADIPRSCSTWAGRPAARAARTRPHRRC